MSHYTLYGWHLSYFAGKTRAYLRYKAIPFADREVDALTLLWRIPRRTGATVMPVVVTPEGEWLQDTKHICEVLEARFPEAPVAPSTPRQRIAALLLEAWADEFWMPTAMHYRWSFPENFELFRRDAGDALLPGFPRFMKEAIVAYVAKTLRGYLPAVGVVEAQFDVLERWTVTMLDHLERHFAAQPFLFGTRPSVADFGLIGPLYGHLGRDPWPRRNLVAPRPALAAWIERMNAPVPRSGEFAAGDALAPTLDPLLDSVFGEFLPMVEGIRDAVRRIGTQPGRRLPRALAPIEFPLGPGRFSRAAMPYTLWMMQRIDDQYRALPEAERASVSQWLAQRGAPAPPYAADLRLERAGLHVRRAA